MAEAQGALPSVIKSLIIFGLGQGVQLEKLLDEYDVEKLFLVEPNRDFFYASLFSIDWSAILQKIDEREGRLYLNIGDDGTHLVKDILRQFQTIIIQSVVAESSLSWSCNTCHPWLVIYRFNSTTYYFVH